MKTSNQEPPASSKPPNYDLKDMDVLCTFKIKIEIKNYHLQIKIKMPNPSQEPPASSKAPNEDLKDMDFLWTFKIKIESKNFDHGCTKDQGPYSNQDQDA